jgi:hypothetical protein
VLSMRRADHSSRVVLPNVLCLEGDHGASVMGGPGPLGAVEPL